MGLPRFIVGVLSGGVLAILCLSIQILIHLPHGFLILSLPYPVPVSSHQWWHIWCTTVSITHFNVAYCSGHFRVFHTACASPELELTTRRRENHIRTDDFSEHKQRFESRDGTNGSILILGSG